jgi:predicted metalloprotease
MDFDDNADLDTSQIDDVRASGGSGGGGFGGMIPGGGMTIGGGVVGLIIFVVLGMLGGTGNLPGISSGSSNSGDNRALAEKCAKSNPDRFREADCRQGLVFNDLRAYWKQNLFPTMGAQYRDPRLTLFSQQVNTACGAATSDVGPFYCPGDQHIYIDIAFYNELATRFGAPGEFAQAYVIAHEFGHHIQFLTGTEQEVRRLQQRDPGRTNQYSVAMELQADCYAGVWTNGAASPGGLVGTISPAEIKEALQAAAAVGDDRIQKQATGKVNPETWTHGSAEQRQRWFTVGQTSGNPKNCNTFSAL